MKKTFPIPVSNGLLEHCQRMGAAVWYFMWCIDKTTKEKVDEQTGNAFGIVLGGKPCHDEDIAANLQVHINTARNWRKHLVEEGYIQTTRTPNGYSIRVAKSKKWSGEGAKKNIIASSKDSQELVTHSESSDSQNVTVESQNHGVESQETADAIRQNSDLTGIEQRASSKTAASVYSPKPVRQEKWKEKFIEAVRTIGRAKKLNLLPVEPWVFNEIEKRRREGGDEAGQELSQWIRDWLVERDDIRTRTKHWEWLKEAYDDHSAEASVLRAEGAPVDAEYVKKIREEGRKRRLEELEQLRAGRGDDDY